MGTPDFAVPSLEALIASDYSIPLVVTQPDRPKGRGQKLQPPPVKEVAIQNGIEVYQPESLKSSSEAREKILETPCDFLVVVAFGQILPNDILSHPKVAPLNVHASLLPAYRGAAPIARSIMEGEQKTGVTIQWMIEPLDQGDILLQVQTPISDSDTSGSLHDRLKDLGAQALLDCLKLFHENRIIRRSQDARVGSYAAKLQKDERMISFNQPSHFVHRSVMGMNPWPVAQCQLMGENLKIYRTELIPRMTDAEPGTIVDTQDGMIVVACQNGCVGITEVQLENRNRMSAKDFLRGREVPTGLILGAKHES